ncbi:MAG: GFA family protein [Burkholderiaceae bacterium]
MTNLRAGRERQGQCLCGAVRLTAKQAAASVGACHCSTCRRWSGGPLMTIHCGPQVDIDGQEYVGVYDSSPWAERGFCTQCGSNLFYRLKGTGDHYVMAGLFSENEQLVFADQVFIDEKPAFYDFANQTKNMTGPELFAQVMAEKDSDQNNSDVD